jgi:hypothetical protein
MHATHFFESPALPGESHRQILMLQATISIHLIRLRRQLLHRVSPAELLSFGPGIKTTKLKRPGLFFHYSSSKSFYSKLQSAIAHLG